MVISRILYLPTITSLKLLTLSMLPQAQTIQRKLWE